MISSHLPRHAAAFLTGICSFVAMPSLDRAVFFAVIFACILLLLMLLKKWRMAGLFFFTAYAWAGFCTAQQLSNSLAHELAGKIITVKGHVEGLPEREGRIVRFNLNVFGSEVVNGRQIKGRIRISDYRKKSINPQPGEAWTLLLRVKPSHGFANPAGFDYEKWLFNHKIIATAYIRKPKAGDRNSARVNHRLPDLDQPAYIDHFRLAIARQIDISLAGSPMRGIITALATGDRRAISTQQWSVLQKTGTSHLMAISGLHVGMVAAIAFFVFRFFWSTLPVLSLRLSAHKAAAIAALIFALFYSLLAGFSLPTQRALLMLAVLSVAVISGRNVRPLDVLSLSLLLILLIDPLAILSAGFWLSFSAVTMILYIVLFHQYKQSWAKKRSFKAVSLQWKLSLMMAPLSLLFFQQIPLAGPVANIIAIPVVALLIVPLVLCASLSFLLFGNSFIDQYTYQLANFLLQQLWALLETLTVSADVVNFYPDTSAAAFIGLMFVVLTVVLPTGFKVRKLAAVGFLLFLYPLHAEMRHGEFRMILLDVGQGLSAIIKTGQHSLLFDTGARFSKKFNAGDAVVLPVLKSLSINKLDKLLISHGDNDHSGSLGTLLEGINVQQLLTNEAIPNDNYANYDVSPCIAGKQWNWDGVSFRILHPQEASSASGNNGSCVLKITSDFGSILLPADIEREAELALVSNYNGELKSSILVAPHHGSKTSSTETFLQAVSPELVLIPAGWMNRYHHPSKEVVSRMADRGIATISTGECGAIDVHVGQGGIVIEAFRRKNRKIWDRTEIDKRCRNVAIGLPEIP
ncbi:MAG: DNA internalization-related competence protein ComEC/Rec2 [Gammaproteobacteria bacterium]|nr:DNA internalization-related competence protein ComEC/Rec2 [Gammaproteobacteria bacterium]